MTTTSITAVSASTRSAQSTLRSPDWIQFSTGSTCALAVPPGSRGRSASDSAHDDEQRAGRDQLGREVADHAVAEPGDDRGRATAGRR